MARFINKQSAADYLGISVRALEGYVQQGRISVKYEKGKTLPTANFDPTELDQPTIKPAFESRQIATEQQPDTGKLTPDSGVAVLNSAKLRQCKTRLLHRTGITL
ncbi:hypothetical protein WKK05_32635 [Nostoc sp. UHCC 0302]|uniref:hypothetical protein n=1 Tax=Nostoc sp. UHCC 0302 TaxID=3134896 RepID=UPI00311C90F7